MIVDLHQLEERVRQAARLVQGKTPEISCKEGVANIVTSSDIAIQQFLCAELEALLPGCGFICEEEQLADSRDREYVWVIDPIDGTTNYARSLPEYAISVALAHRREVILGVVYNPARDELFSAAKGCGARLNGRVIRVSQRSFEEGLLCTAMSLYRKRHARICSDIILDAYLACNDVRRFGSCALELCYLAAGLCELYFEFRVMPWDYAAAGLILSEAGGVLTGYNGEGLTLSRPTLLVGANNEANHKRLMSFVTKHINPNTCSYEWQEW